MAAALAATPSRACTVQKKVQGGSPEGLPVLLYPSQVLSHPLNSFDGMLNANV